MTQPAPETSLELEGPCGFLENLFRPTPPSITLRGLAVLCHPHPLFGGTMHNKTLYRLAKRLSIEAGIASLRFNFRGAGRSLGRHDNGVAEVGDVRAAIDAVAREHPGLPVAVVGYSFGAAVGLRAAAADPRVSHLVALGTPIKREWDLSFLKDTTKPRCFVQGGRDEFGDAETLAEFTAPLSGPVDVHVVEGADHLFTGREDEAVTHVVDYLQRERVLAT